MARKQNKEKLSEIYETIEGNPGGKPSLVARLLGLHRSDVTRSLPALEDEGYLVSEDDKGGLWPFRKNKH